MDGMKEKVVQFGKPLLSKFLNLWGKSKYFRIISIGTSSLFGTLLFRNILIRLSWKIKGLPSGYHIGLPVIGVAHKFFYPEYWKNIIVPYATVCI